MADPLTSLFGAQMNLPGMPQLQAQGMPGLQLQGGMGAGGFDAGPMGGTQFNTYLDTMNRNFRDSDLQYANAENVYEQNLKNVPVLDATRDLAMKSLGVESQMYDSGLRTQQAQAAGQADIAQSQQKVSDAQAKQLHNHLYGMQSLGEVLDKSPDFMNDPEAQATMKRIGEAAGIGKLPEPGQWTPQDIAKIKAYQSAAINDPEFVRKTAEIKQTYQNTVGLANAAAGKGVEEIKVDAAKWQFFAMAQMRQYMAEMTMPDDQRKLMRIQGKINAGEPLDVVDLMALKGIASKDQTIVNMNAGINDQHIITQMMLENQNDPKPLRQLAVQMGLRTQKQADTMDTPSLANLLGPKVAEMYRQQNVDDQVAKLSGGLTIMGPDNKPSHYEETKDRHYHLVPGPGVNGRATPSPAVTPEQAAMPGTAAPQQQLDVPTNVQGGRVVQQPLPQTQAAGINPVNAKNLAYWKSLPANRGKTDQQIIDAARQQKKWIE